MLVQNLTPFPHGAKVTSRRPPRPDVALVVKATFALRSGVLEPLADQPALTADTYAEGDDERTGDCLYPGDFADWKANAEVLLRGVCHAPDGKPTAEASVRFAVGGWSKVLRVVGPHAWSDGLVHRVEGLPFTRMDLSYANAFGGPAYPANPVGRGYQTKEAPSVVMAGEALRAESRPVPASFAPINPAWSPRVAKRGARYGATWRRDRAPYFAEDFDWTYFHAAPADQQLSGYLRGDEEIVVAGMLQGGATLRCRLPGLRIRTFLKDFRRTFRELPMLLDTLFVDVEAETVTLQWRGVAPVAEHDLSDLKVALVASEPLADEQPIAHYRAVLEAFEDDPIGIRTAIPAELRELGERQRKLKAGEPLPDEAEIAALDPISAMLRRPLGGYAAAEQRAVAAAASASGPLPPRAIEELAALPTAAADTPPTPVIAKPGRLPPMGLVHRVRALMDQLGEAKKALEPHKDRPEVAARLAEIDALPRTPGFFELDPHYHPPGPLSTDVPGPGADLRERDLSGLDLRGADLRGADLEDALLIKTDLRGADLTGAKLRRAVLYKADVGGAKLDEADLTDANLAEVRARGASFRKATIETAYFASARLVEADFTGVEGAYSCFAAADLSRAKAPGAKIIRGDFTDATLIDATFAGATLTSSVFERADGFRLDLTKASIADARFVETSLVHARLVDARGHRSVWRGAKLDRADVEGAWLTASFFDDVSAVGASFLRANLRQAHLVRANLTRADLSDANLFEADLTRARVEKARFVRAHLYGACLHQAAGADCDFTDANLRRSTLEAAP